MSLVIDSLNVKLQQDDILHQMSLELKEREFISLLGPSGCGKSTLLKSIGGLLEIESGDFIMDGVSLKNTPPERRGVVIVFQDLRLFPHMNVEKNITFSMALQKVPRDVQQERLLGLLKEVRLEGLEKRKIQELSGGQMQRVALARALAADPQILLLDEPFSGLDEKLRLEMGKLVRKLHTERNLITILVTHDKREALLLSDRIALMNEGRIQRFDTPRKLLENPGSKSGEEYLGKVNYLSGIVKEGMFISGTCQWETDCEDGEYEAGIAVDGSGIIYFRQ